MVRNFGCGKNVPDKWEFMTSNTRAAVCVPHAYIPAYSISRWNNERETLHCMRFPFWCLLQWEWLFQPSGGSPVCLGPGESLFWAPVNAGRRREQAGAASPPPPPSLLTPTIFHAWGGPGLLLGHPRLVCLFLPSPSRLQPSLQSLQTRQTHPGVPPSRVLVKLATPAIRPVTLPHPLCVYFQLDYILRETEPLHTHRSPEQCLPHVN